jgi:hypothetical protein
MEDNLKKAIGHRLTAVEKHEGADTMLVLRFDNGEAVFSHFSECCEEVALIDGYEDVASCLEQVLRSAEESTKDDPDTYGEKLWTFYNLRFDDASVSLRFMGESNGYYSVDVDVEWTDA